MLHNALALYYIYTTMIAIIKIEVHGLIKT